MHTYDCSQWQKIKTWMCLRVSPSQANNDDVPSEASAGSQSAIHVGRADDFDAVNTEDDRISFGQLVL
jgi:hypothetical protein